MAENKYWHLQMFKPRGRDGGRIFIESILMLQEEKPIIGTGDWDDIQCRDFKGLNGRGMAIGDIVFIREGQKAIALCVILSDSFTDNNLTEKYLNHNFRYVKVIADYSQNNMPPFPQAQGTLQLLRKKHTSSWKYIDKLYQKIICNMDIQQMKDILLEKKQIILQGAPGTGKTYSTAALALSMIGEDYDPLDHENIMDKFHRLMEEKRIFFTTFHQSMDYEDFVEGLRPDIEEGVVSYTVKDGIFKIACNEAENKGNLDDLEAAIGQFKQKCYGNAMSLRTKTNAIFEVKSIYEDYFSINPANSKKEGEFLYRANIRDIKEYHKGRENLHNVSYVRGIYQYLKDTYNIQPYSSQSATEKDLNYVLIIDEINRGNISKIFGELITLLEADKRQGGSHTIPAKLTYSPQKEFTVPSNLYIIGTMNTTDRSVGYIDYAVRRRFAFYTLTAKLNVVESHYSHINIADGSAEIAKMLFEQINTLINDKRPKEIDADDLMIGHSYFMAASKEKLKMKLQYEIIPLIREYEKDGILTIGIDELRACEKEWLEQFDK